MAADSEQRKRELPAAILGVLQKFSGGKSDS
jgi:hypothetical protein